MELVYFESFQSPYDEIKGKEGTKTQASHTSTRFYKLFEPSIIAKNKVETKIQEKSQQIQILT